MDVFHRSSLELERITKDKYEYSVISIKKDEDIDLDLLVDKIFKMGYICD